MVLELICKCLYNDEENKGSTERQKLFLTIINNKCYERLNKQLSS